MIEFSLVDRAITELGTGLRTLFGEAPPVAEESLTDELSGAELTTTEKRISGRLMRVNHAGEIAARALYQGQAFSAKDDAVREHMQAAGQEENQHLSWCKARLTELNEKTSYLDPFWYSGAFAMGAMAGLVGDKISLGFVAETERQVVKHLDRHLMRLPQSDTKSRAILERMRVDEQSHDHQAREAGAVSLPPPVPMLMQAFAKVMTTSAYWL